MDWATVISGITGAAPQLGIAGLLLVVLGVRDKQYRDDKAQYVADRAEWTAERTALKAENADLEAQVDAIRAKFRQSEDDHDVTRRELRRFGGGEP